MCRFTKSLNVIGPFGACPGIRDLGKQDMTQVVRPQELLHLVSQFTGFGILLGGIMHQAGYLPYREHPDETVGAYVGWQAPIFVRVECPIFVQVLERMTIDHQDRNSGFRTVA